ncbi:hypothetical protein [Paraburkholderia sediminicola]|uniref:hypothetical protein n=1 Tax=Paraburkholderia sediminicola TaxID=458836 RepID=UPI0038BA9DE6
MTTAGGAGGALQPDLQPDISKSATVGKAASAAVMAIRLVGKFLFISTSLHIFLAMG